MAEIVISSYFENEQGAARGLTPRIRIWEITESGEELVVGSPCGIGQNTDGMMDEVVDCEPHESDGLYRFTFTDDIGYNITKSYVVRVDGGQTLPAANRFQVERIIPADGISNQTIVNGLLNSPLDQFNTTGTVGDAIRGSYRATTACVTDLSSILVLLEDFIRSQSNVGTSGQLYSSSSSSSYASAPNTITEFDSPADFPNQINIEGNRISVRWQPGVPTKSTPGIAHSAQGTISWNIPTPSHGCATVAANNSAYCGALVVVGNTPLTPENQPTNGKIYEADSTVNPDIHVGDRIGGALVVGALYEGENKANNEPLTTSIVVNDVDSKTPYYIMVYAVDCQLRYHKKGAAAYSLPLSIADEVDTPSSQVIEFGDNGVNPTDPTPESVCTAGIGSNPPLRLDVLATNSYPKNVNPEQIIHIEISNACTYGDLVDKINRQIALWTIANTPGSSANTQSPPLSGQYAITNNIVKRFDGIKYNIVPGVIFTPTDPSVISSGTYWWNEDTQHLYKNLPDNQWASVDIISSTYDPSNITHESIWFNGTTAYNKCGNIWGKIPTYVQVTNPRAVPELTCTSHWFDDVNHILHRWSVDDRQWQQTAAIEWDTAPNALISGTYWINDSDSINLVLKQWIGSPTNDWSDPIDATIGVTPPITPEIGALWYNPATETLNEFNESLVWEVVPAIVWPIDPTDVVSCDMWWKSTGSPTGLYIWDIINLEWVVVHDFFVQSQDPTLPPDIAVGSVWINPDTTITYQWSGTDWIKITPIQSTSDPSQNANVIWYNAEEKKWYDWNQITSRWQLIYPITTVYDPKNFPSDGEHWFNTSNDTLNIRVAGQWVNEPYATTLRGNLNGTLWLNPTDNILYEWNGTSWIPSSSVPLLARLNVDGNLEFTTTHTGSSSVAMVVVPEGITTEHAYVHGYGCSGVSYTRLNSHSFGFYGPSVCETTMSDLQKHIKKNGTTPSNFLFGTNNINIAKILPQIHGFDAASSTPSYLEQDVGDDGSSDERKQLAHMIRTQLGYPVIDVELTQDHIDVAIRKALDVYRQRSSNAYSRGFFFLDIIPGIQKYKMTSKQAGYNKIVNVMGIYRFTSAFLSSAHGAGVYGQIVLQHLYNMGTYDLTSFHLVSQYIEQMEHLFATRLTFHWHESTRELTMYTTFVRKERVLVEASVERTEQEIMTDRWAKNWIERWALAESQLILARIRGKYASLPGAGGGVTLDAADLLTRAEGEQDRLIMELDDYIAQDIEDYGMGTTFVIG